MTCDLEIDGSEYVAIGLTQSAMPVYERFTGGYQPTVMVLPMLLKWVYPPQLKLKKPKAMSLDDVEKRYGLLYAESSVEVGGEDPIPLKRLDIDYTADLVAETPGEGDIRPHPV